ncbi:MAG TPA: EAL domain-containing protein [Acidiferrobacteraceae bacterium]|nr:EAL domain-containing protein [Acidiferrobacteraceae bacterium]
MTPDSNELASTRIEAPALRFPQSTGPWRRLARYRRLAALAAGLALALVAGLLLAKLPLPVGEHGPLTLLAVALAGIAVLSWQADTAEKARERAHDAALNALAKERDLAETALQAIADAVVIVDARATIVSMNAAAERLTGYSQSEARSVPVDRIFKVSNEQRGQHDSIRRALHHGETTGFAQGVLTTRRGHEHQVEHSAAPIGSGEAAHPGAVLVFHDVTDRHRLTAALLHQARHDYLTGLPNRQALEDALERGCRALGAGRSHALLYLDLDQLKVVNDTCGHTAGDELLRQTARLLGLHVRASDLLARVGGDEFVVLAEDCGLAQGQRIADALLLAVREHRFVWQDKVFVQSVSIGLVPLDADMADPAAALSAADSACYLAKERGRNRVCTYTEADVSISRYREGMNWINAVTEALEQNRLHLYRQRIAPLHGTAGIAEYEILMRLVRESGEVVLPSLFIPAVERYGIMPNIDRWVIRTLVRHLEGQPEDPPCCYSVNISGTSLNDDFFLDFVLEHLRPAHVRQIKFEITETAAITNFPRAQQFIAELRSKGCRFALDDFGSGLSSFTYLRNLEIDSIKIDGSFISNMADDRVAQAIVRSINQVAHDMGLKTVAEFVENDRTLTQLRAMGVDYAQGYVIHEPEPMGGVRAPTG